MQLFFLKKNLLTIMLTIVNEGSSLTIVNETKNFIKRSFLEKLSFLKKKLHAPLLNVVLLEVKKLWGSRAKTSLIFSYKLLNDKYRSPSGRFPIFVNEGSSLTIVNKMTIFIKTIVLKTIISNYDSFSKRSLKNDHFKKRFFIVVFKT